MCRSMIFKGLWSVLVLLVTVASGLAQKTEQTWLKLESGSAMILDPVSGTWSPLADKERIPVKTFILTRQATRVVVFSDVTSLECPPDSYFWVADVLVRDRNELMHQLVQIEASQLPAPGNRKRPDSVAGLTYGKEALADTTVSDIPFRKERLEAVRWFAKNGRKDAALLTLKRAMVKFPDLYRSPELVDLLFNLYESQQLWGTLFEESRRLMEKPGTPTIATRLKQWNDLARKQLTDKN